VGANYLLNIGPTAQGGVDPMQRELMRILGKWMELYGEAIYEGKPYGATTQNAKNFMLKGDGYLYMFVHDLGQLGNVNVTKEGKYSGNVAFNNVKDEIESIEWMDNGEKLDFVQHNGALTVNATGFPYGMSTCVRVAKIKLK
jgi:alpha-L-fucosidase